MRAYERNGIHRDLDEYEEDGEDLEEEGMEYEEGSEEEEEEQEKEDPTPTKEELEYLELRQRLKEAARQRLKTESASTVGHSQEKKKLPYDNYGSFFGPSRPVIARRVLEEGKSILETQHIHARTPNSITGGKKMPLSSNEEKRDSVRHPPPKAVNELKKKVQKLRDTRDYSFLMFDDVEFPIPLKESAPRNGPVPTSDARPAQVPFKGKAVPSISKTVKSIPNGHEGRKSVSTSRQMPTKVAHPKVASTSRPKQPSAGPRKLLGSHVGNGPGRPLGPKVPLPKISTTAMEKKKAALVSAKNSVPVASKAPLLKSQATSQKHYSEQKKDHQPMDKPNVISRHPVDKPSVILRHPVDKPKVMPKKSVPSSKPQMKPPKQMPARSMREDRPKKRPLNQYSDEDMDDDEEAIRMIRNMFGYNPKKYADVDDDVSGMEANFDDILKEERRSAKIAREEDEREQRLTEEEERRMRMRKEAKKRKL
ncbi:hypothetical protein AAC387_Pa03g4090 [Persea americana]